MEVEGGVEVPVELPVGCSGAKKGGKDGLGEGPVEHPMGCSGAGKGGRDALGEEPAVELLARACLASAGRPEVLAAAHPAGRTCVLRGPGQEQGWLGWGAEPAESRALAAQVVETCWLPEPVPCAHAEED